MSCANQNSYDIGDAVILHGDFVSPNTGLPIDPSGEISVTVRKPDGTEDKYVYPTAITRVSTGQYTYTELIDQAGTWYYRWIGLTQAQEEKRFYVKAGVVTPI
jgi:hypothetical protein